MHVYWLNAYLTSNNIWQNLKYQCALDLTFVLPVDSLYTDFLKTIISPFSILAIDRFEMIIDKCKIVCQFLDMEKFGEFIVNKPNATLLKGYYHSE